METVFPCTGCGACCRKIGNIDASFPYKWDGTGKCEKLDDNNKCTVYEDRPLICNIDKILGVMKLPKEQFYKITATACNQLMDEADLPKNLRIKIEV